MVRALAIKRLPFELIQPQSLFELRRWNPQTRKIPVVELDGERSYDSTLIFERLDAVQPSPPLFSSEPRVAAAQRLLEDWADESLYWFLMAERWCPENSAATASQLAEELPRWSRSLTRLALPLVLGRASIAQGIGRLPAELRLRSYAMRLDDLVVLLGERPFFHSEVPSVADIAVACQLHCADAGPTPALAQLVRERPALVAFLRRFDAATSGE